MKNLFKLILGVALLMGCSAPIFAVTQIAVYDPITKLWVPAQGDASGALVISGNVTSSGGGGTASISTGLVAESITQVATGTSTTLSSISSSSTAPMWITIRNVGLTTVHYSPGTPTDSSDGIAAGEQIAMFVSTSTPVLNMRAHSTGVSTITVNIWR